MKKISRVYASSFVVLVAMTTLAIVGSAEATTFTPYWFDGYDVSANTSDINFETATRQGGAPTPISYLANSANPVNDYHHQMFGGGGTPLQLAGDFNLLTALVSPNADFSGTTGTGSSLGKKIEVTMDAGAIINDVSGQYFTSAAITIGASAPLQASNVTDGFSVSFVEDAFGGFGNFIQIYNNGVLIDNGVFNPAGGGPGFVEIFVDDPVDGDPWDGVGTTEIIVLVNGTQIGNVPSYVIGGGGLTSNYITLEGNQQSLGSNLATHTFDNLLVQSGSIPEPSSITLMMFGLCGFALKRK